jgi:hypothetical protein
MAALYLTPEKYRTMGFGIDLDGIENVELASTLARAQSIAEGYCTVPRIPHPHSFLGGVITPEHPEEHRWRIPENDFEQPTRRIYPYHWPFKSVEQCRIYVTNTQYINIPPTELFVNNTERYLEVISLLLTGYGLFGLILPTMGLYQPVSRTAYTYGWHFDVEGEVLYPTDARTYRAQNQHWIANSAKVYLSGVVQATGFTVNYTEGTVVFDNPPGLGIEVAVDYQHKLPSEIRDGISLIATHLLGEREQQARGMTGVKKLAVAEVQITNADDKLTKENLAYIEPEAAWLLDGYKFITVR